MSTTNSSRPMRLLQRVASPKARLKRLRSAGDRARDAGDWATAVEHYRAYLADVSADTAIWVQLGHALKEAARLDEAEAAYARATRLDPADLDSRTHLAHLLKARKLGAADVFLEIFKMSPSADVAQELDAAGYGHHTQSVPEHRPANLPKGGVFIELKDLFQYLSLHTTVTGITRVTLGLIHFILHEMPSVEAAGFHFVHQYGDGRGLILISKEKIRAMVSAAIGPAPDLPAMQSLIQDIRSTSALFRLGAGDTYLIVGAFWEFVANPSWLGGMRRRGVKIGAYIYDLIPITHAQYCVQDLTDAFTLAFVETARLLDFGLSISAFVAREVTEYLGTLAIPAFPIVPIPLAHSLHLSDDGAHNAGRVVVPSDRRYLLGIPFVLCVCTIEARKNHAYLFEIWRRMLDSGVPAPDLVFVGRPGWRVETLMERIEDAGRLGGRVHILYGLSDDELADLYDRCLFTAFPSFVEGWGLPVGESLAHGKVCVASSTSSIPEVGGDHAVYVNPFDLDDGYAAIAALLTEPGKLRRLETELRASFKPRTWNDVGRDFFSSLGGLIAAVDRAGPARSLFAPHLPATQLLETSRLSRAALHEPAYAQNPERLVFAQGWRQVERSGTWMLDAHALAVVSTDCGPEAEVVALLRLGTSPWARSHNILTITNGGDDVERRYRRPLTADADLWIEMEGRTDCHGRLSVKLEVEGLVKAPAGSAPVAVRLLALGYAAADDATQRIALLRRALLS